MIKFKNYTQEELNYLKDNYLDKNVKELAKILGKTSGSISYAIRELGLLKQKHQPWSDEEIQFLKDHYIDMTSEEISQHINHSVNAINTQRDRLHLIRNNLWEENEVEFLRNNFSKMSYKEIGNKLGRSASAVTAKCFDLNLYKKEVPWTDEEIDFLKKNYMEMSNFEISEILQRTECAIHLKGSRLGMKKYPYTCDYHYFDCIDTEEKAYWLGFLTADGWISKNDESNAGVVGCELQYGDLKHLKKFNKSINGNYQITDRWRPCMISKKDPSKKHHSCVIRIYSITMYNALAKLGFTNNKTFDAHIPEIPKNLIRHYLRGYFDGNGCFTLTNKSFQLSFLTASHLLYQDLKDVLTKNGFHLSDKEYITEFNTKMYQLNMNRISEKIQFLNYIYNDAKVYLDRKYKKYQKSLQKYENTQGLTSWKQEDFYFSAEEIGKAGMLIRVEGYM